MIDEEKVFRENFEAFFKDVETGKTQAVASQIARRPLQNFRGETFEWLTMKHQNGQTAFHKAAEFGHASLLELLASKGADVTTRDQGGETALHAAAAGNHIQAMSVLIGLGVSLDAVSKSGASALYKATSQNKLQAMQILLQSKADVELAARTQETPLGLAAREDKIDAVAILLAANASPHAEARDGKTAIHFCIPGYTVSLTHTIWFDRASKGDVTGLRKLLAQQIGSVGDEGWKDLGRALYQPQGQDQFKLNAHRSLCNAKDHAGFTALSRAVQNNRYAACEYLLSQAADPGISDELRETPLHHAARLGYSKLAQKLLEEGAPLEALNLGDVTPLHIAAFLGHGDVCQILVNEGANVHCYDQQHETPLHYAVSLRHAQVVTVLVNAGASLSVQDRDFKTVGVRATEATMNQEKPRPRPVDAVADYDVVFEVPKDPELYIVVHEKAVAVRATPSVDGKLVGARYPKEQVLVREVVNGWAKLDASTKEREQWMLIDATKYGLGVLLKKMPPRQAEEDGDEGLPIVREKKSEATVTATAAAAEEPAAEVEDDEEESDEGDFEG